MAVNARGGLLSGTVALAPLVVWVVLVALASAAGAQNLSSGSIDGIVADDTGGALPGVTVTVSSPALQVQQLTETSDAEGRYRFLDLPRGAYQIKFELSGFQPLIRAGLELSAGFNARVNVSMKIGTMTETVTVSGMSPVVDPTTTRGGQLINSEILVRDLPSNKTVADLILLTPGLTNSAGENPGSLGLNGRPRFNSYGLASGNTNTTMMVDGFQIIANNPLPDVGATQEVDVKTFGNGADVKEVGVAMNLIIKTGGNDFKGSMSESFMRSPWSNLDDKLRARGLGVGPQQKYYNDSGADLGGRILPDKLWFYGAYRDRRSKTSQPGLVRNAGPDGKYLTGDEPAAFPKLAATNITGKLSYQIGRKYQASTYISRDETTNQADIQIAPFGAAVDFAHTPWEATNPFDWKPYTRKVEIRGTPSAKVLFDAQFGKSGYKLYYGIQPESASTPTTYDRTTLLLTGANIPHISNFNFWILNANMTIVPEHFLGGHHEFKVGYYLGRRDNAGARPVSSAGDYALMFDTVNGVPHQPVEIETNNAPVTPVDWDDTYSMFLTDQWRIGQRLTYNLGLRWDGQHSFVPAQSRQAGMFAPAATFPRVEVGKWSSLGPRAAMAWDVTGSGRSLFKLTYGWYNPEESLAGTYDQNASYATDYLWHDLNGDGKYEPGEVNLDPNGLDFLSTTARSSNLLPAKSLKLSHVQEVTTSFEREISAGTAVRFLFLTRRFGNQVATINVLRPYSAFNIPLTRQDPGPDGIVGTADDGAKVTIWDYDPAYRGAAFVGNQIVNRPKGRDDATQSYEVAVNKRLSSRWSLTSSYSATHNHTWAVAFPQSPNDDYFPLDTTWHWDYRLSGNWNLPKDVVIGIISQTLSAPNGTRTYVFRAADPQGGPSLKQQSTVTLRLEPIGSQHEKAYTLLNLRLGKKFHTQKTPWQLSVDVLNVANSNAVKAATYVSGPAFGKVTDIAPPRQIRAGLQVDF
jgi:hypothetical protein